MRLFNLFPVSIIYQALSTRLEYGNVTYQETRKRCEQIIWAKENNLEPNIGNDQRIADDYLSPAHANIRNNYRWGGGTMSQSVMDLKEVCLELCAGGVLIKAMELVKLPNYQSLDPVEFLYECLVSEAARRQTRKVATRIKKSACFYPDACIENTLYAPDRNLNRELIERLAGCDWIRNGEHCAITGATGSGKLGWLAR